MSTAAQHEFHPDAEQLNAFAEHALDERERSRVFAHLAVCSRCRQVLALAQQAAGVELEELIAAAPAIAAPTRSISIRRRPWWQNWHFAWIPAAALAVTTAFAVYLHVTRVERPDEMARIVPPAVQPHETAPVNTAPQQQQAGAPPANPAPHAAEKVPRRPLASPRQTEESTNTLRERAAVVPPPSMPAPAQAYPPSATESVVVTQAANAPETTSSQKDLRIELQSLAQAEVSESDAAKPKAALARKKLNVEPKTELGETAGEVSSASARDNLLTPLGSPQAQPAPGNAAKDTKTSAAMYRERTETRASSMTSLGMIRSSAGSFAALPPVHLPSGLTTVSVASGNHLFLALDQAGTLFLSADDGTNWRPIKSQWAGRAILVRTMPATPPPAPAPSSVEPGSGGAGKPAPQPSTTFEIMNDQHQTWQSTDGITWSAR